LENDLQIKLIQIFLVPIPFDGFFFPQHVLLPHVILRKADGEVAESMRQNPRIDYGFCNSGQALSAE